MRKYSLPANIIREGEKRFEAITPKESKERGRRTITWKMFGGLNRSTVDECLAKMEKLQTAFYSFTYRL